MYPSASDLTYFLAVIEMGSLSKAASKIGIAQPSLTLAIQRLEESVGCQLFVRTGRGVEPTHAGRRVALQTRELLRAWEDLREHANEPSREVKGIYTLGCHPSVALYSFPGVISRLIRVHPGLELRLVHELSRNIADQVILQEIDFGIVVNPVSHPDLVIKSLGTDQVGFHRVEKTCEDVLILDPALAQAQSLLKQLKKKGAEFRRVIHSSNLEVIRVLAEDGAGIAILPGRVAAHSKKLIPVRDWPVFEDRIAAIYRIENKGLRFVQEIVKALVQEF